MKTVADVLAIVGIIISIASILFVVWALSTRAETAKIVRWLRARQLAIDTLEKVLHDVGAWRAADDNSDAARMRAGVLMSVLERELARVREARPMADVSIAPVLNDLLENDIIAANNRLGGEPSAFTQEGTAFVQPESPWRAAVVTACVALGAAITTLVVVTFHNPSLWSSPPRDPLVLMGGLMAWALVVAVSASVLFRRTADRQDGGANA